MWLGKSRDFVLINSDTAPDTLCAPVCVCISSPGQQYGQSDLVLFQSGSFIHLSFMSPCILFDFFEYYIPGVHGLLFCALESHGFLI